MESARDPRNFLSRITKQMETIYTVTVNNSGTFWKNRDGQRHRLGGLPAIEYAGGSKEYYENDQCHRLGGLPAIEYASGSKFYYESGKRHRLGGLPAIEYASGSKEYYENDQ